MTVQSDLARPTIDRVVDPTIRPPRRRIDPWILVMVLPGVALFAVFLLWPLVNAFSNSFFRWDGLGPKIFVGFANYTQVLTSSVTWSSLQHTAVYAVGTALAKIVLAFLIALLVSRRTRGVAFFRSVIFIPVLMSFVAVGVLWTFILDPNQGLLNGALGAVGLPDKTAWLGQPGLALGSIMSVDVWKWLGYHVILFVAGLQSVRPELYEAAKVDGAGPVSRFWNVTVPAMRTMIGLNLIIAIAGALNVFDLVYVMTGGGPNGSTETVMTFMYRQAFNVQQYGFASALASLLFLLVAVVTLIQVRLLRSDYNS
jgi:raffinose/stachyose/melibiose transport system permease protein